MQTQEIAASGPNHFRSMTTEHEYSYDASGYVHNDDCLRCLKDTKLRHEFEQDAVEHAGICRCGDVEFVHLPQTLGRLARRAWFNLTVRL